MNQSSPMPSVPSVPAGQPYARRILLCGVGFTPQVVTETLYALAVVEQRPCPTEIHLIASAGSARRARRELVEDNHRLADLCAQHELPVPECWIHVIRRGADEVDDLRSAADNEAAADTILEVVRQLTADELASIHFSIAGGRKTMTYYLGYCASLFGRAQDDMSHVIVDEHFEQMTEFFFPPATPVEMLDRAGVPRDTADARIDLAPVPFFRLRGRLPPVLLKEEHTFGAAVRILNSLAQPTIRLALMQREGKGEGLRYDFMAVEGLKVHLADKQFALMWMLARLKREGEPGHADYDHWVSQCTHYLMPVYRAITDNGSRADAYAAELASKTSRQITQEFYSLNKALRDQIGPGADLLFGVEPVGTGDDPAFVLRVPKDSISIEGADLIGVAAAER